MQIDGYFTLNHQVEVYVPSTQGLTGGISRTKHDQRTRLVAEALTDLFGGATVQRAQGYYKADNGRMVVETVNIVIAFAGDDTLEAGSEQLLNRALEWCREWEQESLLVKLDKDAVFVR